MLPAGEYVLEAPGRSFVPRQAGPILLKVDEKRSWRLLWDEAGKKTE